MDTRDSNSPGGNRSPGTSETGESSNPDNSRNEPEIPNLSWIRGERRLPENAKIRHWMNLGDKALQNAEEEPAEENPIPEK